jgi:hypothetical protein
MSTRATQPVTAQLQYTLHQQYSPASSPLRRHVDRHRCPAAMLHTHIHTPPGPLTVASLQWQQHPATALPPSPSIPSTGICKEQAAVLQRCCTPFAGMAYIASHPALHLAMPRTSCSLNDSALHPAAFHSLPSGPTAMPQHLHTPCCSARHHLPPIDTATGDTVHLLAWSPSAACYAWVNQCSCCQP